MPVSSAPQSALPTKRRRPIGVILLLLFVLLLIIATVLWLIFRFANP
jgi:hypothetical protein